MPVDPRYAPGRPPKTVEKLAYCADCGARLSKYRTTKEKRCLPCQLELHRRGVTWLS